MRWITNIAAIMMMAAGAMTLPERQANAQVNLNPGDLVVTQWDDLFTDDSFTVFLLADIPAGTVVYFTDNGWTGTGYRGVTSILANGTEDLCRLTFNTDVPAGTLVPAYVNSPDWTWKVSGAIGAGGNYNEINVNPGGDQIYIVQSTSTTNPLFSGTVAIFVMDDTGGFENATSGQTGNIPPGLSIADHTAISINAAVNSGISFSYDSMQKATKKQWLRAMTAIWNQGSGSRETPIVLPDPDLDGVIDSLDTCVDTPSDQPVDSNGCTCAQSGDCAGTPVPCLLTKLVASAPIEHANVGVAVAIDGDTAAVASNNEVGPPIAKGLVRIYTFANGTWTLQQVVGTSSLDAVDFGSSLALSGDTLLVGAPSDNQLKGAVYAFTRSDGVWTEQQKLVQGSPDFGDDFGSCVAIEGDTALIGAPGESSMGLSAQGAAYVFTRTGNTWTQQKKLFASNATDSDNFGASVALDGETLVVGAPDGNGALSFSGAAYVFTRSRDNWIQQQMLSATGGHPSDAFGSAVSLEGETAIVGAFLQSTPINDGGAVYVFTRSGTVWTQQQMLQRSNSTEQQQFGSSIDIAGDRAVIGASSVHDEGFGGGSVTLLTRSAGAWSEAAVVHAADGTGSSEFGGVEPDSFGRAAAISTDTILIGAPFHDLNLEGARSAGAAYLFTIADCNGNEVGDWCDLQLGTSVDADADGVIDECDLCLGFNDSLDTDGDGTPDGCDACPGGGSVTFYFDLAQWQAAAANAPGGEHGIVTFSTTAANLALAEEVAAAPGDNAQLGGVLTFLDTPMQQQFSVKCLEPGAGFTFNDQEGSAVTFTNALSVGDINNFENDDWEFEFLPPQDSPQDPREGPRGGGPDVPGVPGVPGVHAFGLDTNDFSVEAGETFSVYCEGLGLISVTMDGPTAALGFFGVVSDIPIRKVTYDEGAGNDDIAIANFRWTGSPPPEPPPCPADLNGDDGIDGADLGLLLGNWGNPGQGDIDGSGFVDGADLGLLLGAWGACPSRR